MQLGGTAFGKALGALLAEEDLQRLHNDLEVLETVVPISARMIANKASFGFKSEQIEEIRNALQEILEERGA